MYFVSHYSDRLNMTLFKKRLFREGLLCYLTWTFCLVFLVENNICIFCLYQCFLRRVVIYYNPQEAVAYQEDGMHGQAQIAVQVC